MSSDPVAVEALRALILSWRKEAVDFNRHGAARATSQRYADELDALLSAVRQPQMQENTEDTETRAEDTQYAAPLATAGENRLVPTMTEAEVIAAIRLNHLKSNVDDFESNPKRWGVPQWDAAWIDPGGTIFGEGPYLKVPIMGGEWDGTIQRVYPPARLRRRLQAALRGDREAGSTP